MSHSTLSLIPVFNGTWVDSVRGRKCQITNGATKNMLDVVDAYRSHAQKGRLILINPKEKTVMLCAQWGKKGSLRTWKGIIEKDGKRIRWGGLKGITYWNRQTEYTTYGKQRSTIITHRRLWTFCGNPRCILCAPL